jgi:PAS domain S-box-containing protein
VGDINQSDSTPKLLRFGPLQEPSISYRDLLNSIPDGLLILDSEGRFVLINDAIATRLGFTGDSVLGSTCFDCLQHGERESARRHFGTVLDGSPVRLEVSRDEASGKRRWDRIEAVPLVRGGAAIGVLAIVRDVTDKREAEEALELCRSNLETLVEERTAELVKANDGLRREVENRVCAENALRDSEDYYRAIFQNTGTAMVIMEEDTTIVSVNKESVRFVGHTPEELEGKRKAIEFTAPEHFERVWANRTQRLIDPATPPRSYEFSIVDRFGIPKNIYMTVVTIPEKRKIIASFIDITELRETEKALKQSEAYYRTIFENSGTAIVVLEEDTTISLVNGECYKLLGYYPSELEGKKKAWELVAETDREKMLDYHRVRRCNPDSPPKAYELRLLHRSGRIKEFQVIAAMIPGTTKSIISFFDLSERKEVEAALAESEKKYRDIFERATEGIFQTGMHGELLNANPAFARMFGYKSAGDVMKSVTDITTEICYDDKQREKIRKLLTESGQVRAMEVEGRRRDGKKIWVTMNMSAVRSVSGQILFYEGTLADVTARKKMEEEIRSKTESLEETNAALRVLLKHRESDNVELEEKVVQNVRDLVLPYVERIKQSNSDRDVAFAEIVESNLNDILTPFVKRMAAKYATFTPKEIQIADLMKKGKSTKEIAGLLSLSIRTVDVHRYKIRQKLGIKNKKINLQSYLLSLQ